MSRQNLLRWGWISLVLLAAIAASILWLDQPLARFFFIASGHVSGLAKAFGTSEMVGGDCLLMLVLAVIRIIRGSLPDYGKVLFIACGVSLSAFAANDYVLKLVFGRYGPYAFLANPSTPQFNLFQGDQNCVFPSGHMVMSTAFAAVLIRIYPRSWPVFAGLLGVGAVLLLIGDWHFLSDVLAGLFTGGTLGFMAGELWYQHVRRLRPA